MDNKMLITLVVIGILLVGGYITYSSGPIVSAVGTSSIEVQPDEVSVNINVESRNKTAALAQEQNKVISDELLTQLVKLGFERKELQFVNENTYQEYDYSDGKQTPKGFVVSQQLVVKTTSVDKVPSIVDAAISSGALISYINFELSDAKQKEIKKLALEAASKDAREQAKAQAAGQDRTIGRLVSIQNQEPFYGGPIALYAKEAGAMPSSADAALVRQVASNLNPQDIEITASVSAQYKLSLF